MNSERPFIIHLIDDDTKHLVLLKNHLEKKCRFNLDLHIFTSGENSIDKFTELKPDIIILDYYLDGINPNAMNGIEVLKKVKTIAPEIDVVMMSAQESIQIAVDTLEYGAYDYIIKNDTAFMRAQLIIDNIVRSILQKLLIKEQKMIQGILISILLILVGSVLFLAVYGPQLFNS